MAKILFISIQLIGCFFAFGFRNQILTKKILIFFEIKRIELMKHLEIDALNNNFNSKKQTKNSY